MMVCIRDEINRKILAYEEAALQLGRHETVAKACLSYARKEMLEVLERVDRAPFRKASA
jgi:hypothetical protein